MQSYSLGSILAFPISTGKTEDNGMIPPFSPSILSHLGPPSSCFRRQRFLGPCHSLPLSPSFGDKFQKTNYHKREEGRQRKKSFCFRYLFLYLFLTFLFLRKKKRERERERPKPDYRSCHVGIMFLGTFNRLSDYFSTSLARWLGLSNFLFLLGLVAKRHSITSLSLMTGLLWSAKTACRQHRDMAYTRWPGLVTKRCTLFNPPTTIGPRFSKSFFHKGLRIFPSSFKW